MSRHINIQGDPSEKKSLVDRSRSRSKYNSIDSSSHGSSTSDTAAEFLRKTTKFWVLPSNIHTVPLDVDLKKERFGVTLNLTPFFGSIKS